MAQPINVNDYENAQPRQSATMEATGITAEIPVEPVYISTRSNHNNRPQQVTETEPLINRNANNSTEYSRDTEEIIYKNMSKINNKNLANVYHNYFREGVSGRQKNRKTLTRKQKQRKQCKQQKQRKQTRKTRTK
jgi:hypothetical protein